MTEIWGTVGGRWYVTLFAVAYLVLGLRVLGGRKLAVYTLAAFGVAALLENLSVRFGIPYARYAFNQSLRGRELWIGDVPLFVPFSYTFVIFFSFAAARAVAAGPWRRVPPSRTAAYVLGAVFATWAMWTLDPISQRGALFYLGDLFHYDQPGFWFGLPLLTQIGWFATSSVLCGLLAWMTWRIPPAAERPLRNPLLWCLAAFLVQVQHLSVVGIFVGEQALGASGILMWVPAAAVTAVLWVQCRTASS
jgi:uncharacterized membrane protein